MTEELDNDKILEETIPDDAKKDEDIKKSEYDEIQESKKYRRQAQGYEKRAKELAEEVNKTVDTIEAMQKEIQVVRFENDLYLKLHYAGASDIETAALVVCKELQDDDKIPVEDVISAIKINKPHLFRKEKTSSGIKGLQKNRGTRSDIHDYMRNKRNSRGN